MAYTAWSVVYGEQPTAAKWNQLGTNDAGFKDGTNIDNLAILTRHIADDNVTPQKLLLGSQTAVVAAGESTSSTSFTDLATVGPTVTVTVPASGVLLVLFRAQFSSGPGNMCVNMSGANSYSAQQTDAVYSNNLNSVMSGWLLFTGLNAGSTTIKAVYKSDSGASSFLRRHITVIPLG